MNIDKKKPLYSFPQYQNQNYDTAYYNPNPVSTYQQHDVVKKRLERVQLIGDSWQKRQFPPNGSVSKNIQLKIVGNTGTSYVVPQPDWNRYQQEWSVYESLSEQEKQLQKPPILHYFNGPVINMNKWQRERQSKGSLPGCLSNCNVVPPTKAPPIERHGKLLGTQFPDADVVMNPSFYEKI